jgi:thioredoxin-dependent peroxiredoxin
VQAAGAVVLGVSPDGVGSHAKFKRKFELPFPLLADEDHAVAEAYGVWGEKSMYGRKYMGILRTTFVIDEAGRISHVFEKVKPKGHAAEVLAVLGA